MSTTTSNYKIDLIYTGQTICVPVDEVKNNSGVTATDVIVKLDKVPDGLSFSSTNLTKGTYDENSRIWSIGSLTPLQVISGLFCFTVTDDSKAPFQLNFTVGLSEFCDTCDDNNKYCATVDGLTVTDLVNAGLAIVEGVYNSDAEAIADGLAEGDYYELGTTNIYGLPPGHIKRIKL